MNWQIALYHPSFNNEVKFLPLSEKELIDFFKANPQALCRLPYFIQNDHITQITTIDQYSQVITHQKIPLNGSLIVTHSIKRAKDIVLDPVGIENINCQIEISGNKLPEIPPKSELEILINQENTLIIIDSKPYKPQTEIFTFQHVYDDTVKFIEQLKKIGITNEYIQITATAEEITLEIHPKAFNITVDNKLPTIYSTLLYKLAGLKHTANGWIRTTDKTIDLSTTLPNYKILLPGNVHPILHRPKVAVGPSHFAYGIAAFADYCGKKRTIDECIKELKNWIKFITTDFQPIPKAVEFVNSLELIAHTASIPESLQISLSSSTSTTRTSKENLSPTIIPFLNELKEKILPSIFTKKSIIINTFNEWTKSIGGAISFPSMNLFASCKEEGKLAFILNLMFSSSLCAKSANILLCSFEHSNLEIFTRLLCYFNKIQISEISNIINFKNVKVNDQNFTAFLNKLNAGIQNIPSDISQSFYYRGIDHVLDIYDIHSLSQLLKMLPQEKPTILILDSLPKLEIDFLDKIKSLAFTNNLAVFFSLHLQNHGNIQKPHFIEGFDLEILHNWQKYFDSITILQTEKINLKKFIAITHGKVEQPIVEKYEKFFSQHVGNTKSKNDTYTLARVIHSRFSVRSLILYYYQRDLQTFIEGPSIPLMKN